MGAVSSVAWLGHAKNCMMLGQDNLSAQKTSICCAGTLILKHIINYQTPLVSHFHINTRQIPSIVIKCGIPFN